MSDEVKLTEAQIDAIVDKAVEKTFQRLYQEVGKSVLTKIAWLTGAAVIGLFMWLGGHNSRTGCQWQLGVCMVRA
jgi:tetrahydromethanopterin S-methyltransferase subunit G